MKRVFAIYNNSHDGISEDVSEMLLLTYNEQLARSLHFRLNRIADSKTYYIQEVKNVKKSTCLYIHEHYGDYDYIIVKDDNFCDNNHVNKKKLTTLMDKLPYS